MAIELTIALRVPFVGRERLQLEFERRCCAPAAFVDTVHGVRIYVVDHPAGRGATRGFHLVLAIPVDPSDRRS